jgi:predicted  nucleic acid-binding Zn-ribbon protein
MSDHESDEPLTTTHDEVTVQKRYEPDDFPVPAIAFTITSERDEAVTVRLSDTVPEDTPTEDIGFHPSYGAEQWDVEGNTIVFTREFEPHEEFVTVYGLRGKDASDPERFLTEPELSSVDAVEGDVGDDVGSGLDDGPTAESSADEDAGADVDEPAATESDAGADVDADPEVSEGPEATADEDDPSLDIDLPGPDDAVADDPAETEIEDDAGAASDSGASASAPAADGDETLAATLADEISEGRVDDADLAELRDALGVTAEDSTNARIEHLQSSVADLEAYTDAIEEFLDEEGDAQAVLRDVRNNYQSTVDRFDDLTADIDDVRADLAADTENLRDDLAMVENDLGADVEDLRNDLAAAEDDLAADVEDLQDDLAAAEDDMESNTEDLREELAAAEDDLGADVEDLRDDLAAAEDDLAADIGDLREDLADVEAEVTEATEERIEALESDIEAVEAELADVSELRDRLVDALGGMAGAGAGDQQTTGDATVGGDGADDDTDGDDDAGGTGIDQVD